MLFGRDAERAQIGALLEAARASHSGALVVVGEPGIGKTALLEDTRERASDMHVLHARGVESESELPFAALHQLLRPALAQIDHIPEPQANALRGALGLLDPGGHERFLVFAACLSLLSELAERRPVLCLIDDAHWLDAASADALHFVARRLDAEGIVMLFGARTEHSFESADVPTLRLEGLDEAAAVRLLASGIPVHSSAEVRERLLEQALGNPLALIEVPAALSDAQLSGLEPLPGALPLTRQVERVFLERVHGLAEDAQRLLVVAAADDSESAATVMLAAHLGGSDSEALGRAEAAGLVSVHGGRLEFRHPLIRSAVFGAATSSERRAAHRLLAEALAGDSEQADRRAWHLAAAALEPDETVVAALVEAAERAQRRAAYPTAVRAYERAAELSAGDDARAERLSSAARCASIAGSDARAAALARRAQPLLHDASRAAEMTHVLALADVRRGRPANALPFLLSAARETGDTDPALALELLLDAAWAANEGAGESEQLEVCELAERFAPAAPHERAVFIADLLGGLAAIARREPQQAAPLLTSVVATAEESGDPRRVVWSGIAALWLGDYPRSGVLLEHAVALCRARGALGILAPALASLALQEFLSQRFERARLAGLEALKFAVDVGAQNVSTLPLFVLAGVAAIRGEDDEAERRAREAFELAGAHALPLGLARPVWALALLDLGRGRWPEAVARLETLSPHGLGFAGMLIVQTFPDRIEAAVRAGDTDSAQSALEELEDWGARSPARWLQPRLASCRALVGSGAEATAHYEHALAQSRDARPFDLARIQLLFGEHLRRERRRSDARLHLRAALEAFERFNAEPWAERARGELRASGETARKRDPSTSTQLTPQELQIARYVSDGLSNKEVAAQLFLSPRTVDAHLRNIFSKLAVTSRTQLARLVLSQKDAERTAAGV